MRVKCIFDCAHAVRAGLIALVFALALVAGTAAPAFSVPAHQDLVCEPEMARAAQLYGVPLGVLFAVGLTETGRNSRLEPFALNISGTPYFARSKPEALARFAEARRDGHKLVDMGCMQINHHYHGHKFTSPDQMLEPRANVQFAARFLRELYVREGNWTMAVARYHAGPNNEPAQKRYICHVIRNLVRSGFGGWTPDARAFCGE